MDVRINSIIQDSSNKYYLCGDIDNSQAYYMKVLENGVFNDADFSYHITSHTARCLDIVIAPYPNAQSYLYISGEIQVTTESDVN